MKSAFLQRYWFLAGLLIVIPLGLAWPGPGQQIKAAGWIIPMFVSLIFVMAGFTTNSAHLARQIANYRGLLTVLMGTYLLAPAAAYGLAKLLAPEGDAHFLSAVMIMAAQSSSLASAIAFTYTAGGNQSLAVLVTLFSTSLTAVLTPLILHFSIQAHVSFPVKEMMLRLVLVLLLPLALGQLLRRWLWDRAASLQSVLRYAPQSIILIFVYVGFSSATESLRFDGILLLRFLAVSIILHLFMLAYALLGAASLRLSWPDRTAMAFCGAQKSLPNGIYLWDHFFSHNPFGAVPLVLYHTFQLVFDSLLIPLFRKRNSAETR